MQKQGKWEFLKPIAQMLMAENPSLSIASVAHIIKEQYGLNHDPEALRKIISRVLNQTGDVKDYSLQQPQRRAHIYQTQTAPVKLEAKPLQQPVLHTKITKPGNYLILGCWHVPFHNVELTKRVYELLDTHQFEGLILLGDFLDCNTLSSHDKGKFTAIPGLTLDQEYAEGKVVLKELLSLLPNNAAKVFMYGNHEDRYNRFVADMQNAKTPPKSPTEGLDLYGLDFTVVESYAAGYITLGQHLDLLHGIYYNTHCAKAHIDRLRGSVVFAHTHRIQSYIEGRTGGFNIGWGGNVNHRAFNYADRGTKASWQNGFAVATIDERGCYYLQQVVATDSRFVYGGKQY